MSEANTRLNKYISESGLCSRRAADRYIETGQVFINGKRAKVGDKVFFGDVVMVNGILIEPAQPENTVLLAYNKPVGITSTTEAKVKDNIVDHVNYSERVFPIGRLDKDSQGLIFLTNNGDLVNKILRAGNNHEKEYLVTVNKPLTAQFIANMSKGVPVLGVMTKKCKVVQEAPTVFRITLIQGLNRQIRRMCEHFGYDVIKLERVRIMNITLKGIPLGEWRELDENELAEIFKLTAQSRSEKIANPKAEVKKDRNLTSKEKRPEMIRAKNGAAAFQTHGERERNSENRAGKTANSPSKQPKASRNSQTEAPSRNSISTRAKNPKNQAAANDWFKNNGPNKRASKPTKGKSGVPAAKT